MMSASYRQDAIRTLLEQADGEIMSLSALLRAIYGSEEPNAESSFRSTLNRLRTRRPDLEIEHVGGYRLRRAGRARDRRRVR